MKLGVTVILYHPDLDNINRMISLFTGLNLPLVLVDNSPTPLDAILLSSHYVHFPANIGIAAAQNRGLEYLISIGVDYALVFDQDSQISESLIAQMQVALMDAQTCFSDVAAIGPTIVCEFNDKVMQPRFHRALAKNDKVASVRQIIASGMLISLAAYKVIGPKDESLFIDGVDHEWCWRARNKGFSICQSLTATMQHRLGDARLKIAGIEVKQGAPVRLYYQARNLVTLSRKDYVPLYWKCRNWLALPLRWYVNRFRFDSGHIRSRYLLRGLKDGFAGKSGKLTDWTG